MDDKVLIQRIKQLVEKLNAASDAYYLHDNPIMSDHEYDEMMDKLESLEEKTGYVLSNSPLHKVQGKLLDGFKKVEHTKPMLSANKTKDMSEIGKFIGSHEVVESFKLDGLTIVVRYENGVFKQAITRGNGEIGEDVTENFRNCTNLPLKLRYDFNLEVRGECVISWENFNKINESLEESYSHPRNLAAGSLRCLDTNVSKDRHLEYIAFELVDASGSGINNDNIAKADLIDTYEFLKTVGFDVVPHHIVDVDNYEDIDADLFNPEEYGYPVDGTIFKYNSYEYGKSLGMTAHHPLDMIARKWRDEEIETTLKEVQWQLGKTGQITPVAVFDPVEIDGSIVEKATLHNLSIMEKILGRPYIGQKITVIKSNAIIPQVIHGEKCEYF